MQYIHNKKRPFPAVFLALPFLLLLCIVLCSHYGAVVTTPCNSGAQMVKYDFSGNHAAIVEPFHLLLACLQQGL